MSGNSLRDQLKALGLVKPKPEKPAGPERGREHSKPGKASADRSNQRPTQAGSDAEISLAKAYAARQAAEQAEAAELRRQQEEKAKLKRERKAAAMKLLDGRSLSKPDADLPRHFEYGKKIRRIYVDAEQLHALNTGRLGVAQLDGKFLLVDQAVIDELGRIAPEFVALRIDPAAQSQEDSVPADLHW